MIVDRSQRWRERRSLFAADRETVDPRRYVVEAIEHQAARAFVAEHHYLASWPAAQLAVGLFEADGQVRERLVGVAVFAVPAMPALIPRHAGLSNAAMGSTLARFVLLDQVPQNGETFFLARAVRVLRREKPAVEAVISYADPAAGHVGQVYAALSGAYRGRTPPRAEMRLGAMPIPGRTLSKIRLGERGAGAAIDRLVALGAPRPTAGEDGTTWIARLVRERVLVRVVRPGLHAYCFALTRRARLAGRYLPRLPYPTLAGLVAEARKDAEQGGPAQRTSLAGIDRD